MYFTRHTVLRKVQIECQKKARKKIPAIFYCSPTGAEPVRGWLKKLSAEDRRVIGLDIATVEFGWPVGMPVCRPIVSRRGLRQVRSTLSAGRIARVMFCIYGRQVVLSHGFIKKNQQTPGSDLDLAIKRKKEIER